MNAVYQMPQPEITGWMLPEELQWLYEQALVHRDIVEVGSWFGRSTHALCCGCRGTVWAVDHFLGSPSELCGAHTFAAIGGDVYAEFQKNCGHFQSLKPLLAESITAARTFMHNSCDMIFLDAEHTHESVLADLAAWLPKLRVGGLFCGHDFGRSGIPSALKEYFGNVSIQNPVGSIWVKP
jgi:hypothetical protein